MIKKRLNLGCGSITPDGWLNVDYAFGANLAKWPFFKFINRNLKLFHLEWNPGIMICDLRKQFPWETSTIDVIYSSHTLEHFSKEEGYKFLLECYRVLKPGNGIVRILVPDLSLIVSDYREGRILSEDLIDELGCNYGDGKFSRLISFPHKCMYDASSLKRIMTDIGFQCQVKQPFESAISDIHQIEEPSGSASTSVIIEGEKPIVSTLSR